MFFDSWVIFALLATATYACSHIIDKFTLDKIFKNTEDWLIGICLTSLIPTLALVMYGGIPQSLAPVHALLAFLSGSVLFLCFYYYAKSLKKTDVDVVTALQQFDPIYAVLIGVLFLNETISTLNLFGIVMVIAMAIAISFPIRLLKRKKGKKDGASLNRTPFFYIQISCLIFVISSAVIDHLLLQYSTFDVMIYYFFGTFMSGFIYWFATRKKNQFVQTIKEHKKQAFVSLLAVQVTNAFAIYFVFRAYELGSFSMVTALMATEPFIVMGLIYLFNKFKPGMMQHFRKEDLYIKVPAYFGIFVGIHFMLM